MLCMFTDYFASFYCRITRAQVNDALKDAWYIEIKQANQRPTTVTVTLGEGGGGQKILKKTLQNVTLGVWGS